MVGSCLLPLKNTPIKRLQITYFYYLRCEYITDNNTNECIINWGILKLIQVLFLKIVEKWVGDEKLETKLPDRRRKLPKWEKLTSWHAGFSWQKNPTILLHSDKWDCQDQMRSLTFSKLWWFCFVLSVVMMQDIIYCFMF